MTEQDQVQAEQIVSDFDVVDRRHADWFLRALTHRSYANEENVDYDNERLEFLGDAVLDLIVCEHLFREYSDFNEGRLSEIKSATVNTSTLTDIAETLQLNRYLRLSRGEAQSTRGRGKLLADSLEAFIGALYITSGLVKTRDFILPHIRQAIQSYLEKGTANYKGQLLEHAQQRSLEDPDYRVLRVEGPEHDPSHTVAVYIGEEQLGTGTGRTKKEAEQKAAREALESLQSSSSTPS